MNPPSQSITRPQSPRLICELQNGLDEFILVTPPTDTAAIKQRLPSMDRPALLQPRWQMHDESQHHETSMLMESIEMHMIPHPPISEGSAFHSPLNFEPQTPKHRLALRPRMHPFSHNPHLSNNYDGDDQMMKSGASDSTTTGGTSTPCYPGQDESKHFVAAPYSPVPSTPRSHAKSSSSLLPSIPPRVFPRYDDTMELDVSSGSEPPEKIMLPMFWRTTLHITRTRTTWSRASTAKQKESTVNVNNIAVWTLNCNSTPVPFS